MDARHLVGVVLTCLGLAFFLIGVITPVWVSHQPGIWPPCHGNTSEVAVGTKGLWEECSKGKGQLRCSDEKGQPGNSNRTGHLRSLNGTGQPRSSNETGQPRSSNETGQPRTSNGKGHPSCSNGMGQPIWTYIGLNNQTTTFHVTRFSVMLGLMLLLPGAFLAVTTACRGELDSELDGLEIFTTLIILGGAFGGIGALCYTCDYVMTHASTPLGVSFYLTWIQTAFTVPGGILIWQKSKDEMVSV